MNYYFYLHNRKIVKKERKFSLLVAITIKLILKKREKKAVEEEKIINTRCLFKIHAWK